MSGREKVKARKADQTFQAARQQEAPDFQGLGGGWVPVASACFNAGFLDVMVSLVEANIYGHVDDTCIQ